MRGHKRDGECGGQQRSCTVAAPLVSRRTMEHLQWPKLVKVWLSTVLRNGPPRVLWYTTTKQRVPIGSTVLLRMVSWNAASFWSRQQRIPRGIEIYDAIIWHRTAVLKSLAQRPGAHDQQKLQYQNHHVTRMQCTLKRIKFWSFTQHFGPRGVSSHYSTLRTKDFGHASRTSTSPKSNPHPQPHH
jgi:hypothetical protein